MRYRLVCTAAALVLTGCFQDPPSTSSGGDTSSGSSSGSSTGAPSPTTGTTEAGSSTSVADASDSGGGSSSSGVECELFDFDPGDVPVDIVVLIDDETPVDQLGPVLDELQGNPANNVALLAPQAALAELEFDSDCPTGCGDGCAEGSTRITVPYVGDGYEALANFDAFDCVFREPMGVSSGPAPQLFFITASPEQMPPMDLGALILDGEVPLRVHVACPGCNEDLLVANALLREVVLSSGGSVSNTMNPATVAAQASLIGARRLSCLWAAPFAPEFYYFEPEGPDFGDETEFFAGRGSDLVDCGFEEIDDGVGIFVEVEESLMFLCPATCATVQRYPAEAIAVSECVR